MSEDGVINSISIYHNGGSGNMLLAVYSDDDGEPYYRSAITESKAVNSTAGWQTVELTQYLKVEAGDTIWLAWVFESNPGTRYTSGSPSKAVSSQYWAGQMPQEFGSSSSSSYIYSICANYSPEQAQQEVTLIGNPYMYTAREYDIETGLYYYRARYYNPYIGRFLQTDPAYQGMNWYAYCGNNSLNCTDPSGCISTPFSFVTLTEGMVPTDPSIKAGEGFRCYLAEGLYKDFNSIANCVAWMCDVTQENTKNGDFREGLAFIYSLSNIDDVNNINGWKLSVNSSSPNRDPRVSLGIFWYLQIINVLLPKQKDGSDWFNYDALSASPFLLRINLEEKLTLGKRDPVMDRDNHWIRWSENISGDDSYKDKDALWNQIMYKEPIIALAHELQHAANWRSGYNGGTEISWNKYDDGTAIRAGNQMRNAIINLMPGRFPGGYIAYKRPHGLEFTDVSLPPWPITP
jgi:RHS repeat-associated protein